MTDTLVMIAGLLADEAPKDTGPDFGKASPFGLLIVVLLLVGTFLLVWSMNKRLKNLPESFEPERSLTPTMPTAAPSRTQPSRPQLSRTPTARRHDGTR